MSTAPDTERPPHRPRHRWLAAIVVVLLIAIPAGYLAMSAWQSRESGEDKARSASARALIYEWPSKVQRRIYDIPIPDGSTYVGYYETNAWQRSTMYVQFRTTPASWRSSWRRPAPNARPWRRAPSPSPPARRT